MKKIAAWILALSIVSISGPSTAGEAQMEVAAHLDLGGSSAYGSTFDDFENDEKGPRFAAGLGGNLFYFLTPMFALDMGLQFTGRGYSFDNNQGEGKMRVVWLEIPLGVVADINGFYLGAALSFDFAVSNEVQMTFMGIERSMDGVWDGFRRFNIAPKLTAAYTIPVGPVELMPGVAWSMHLLNEIDDATDQTMRSMNFMVTVGAKYGLPFRGPTI